MKNKKILPIIENRNVNELKTGFEIVNQDDSATIYLYDEIGGWGKYANEVVSELEAITASNITVRINSPGGSVFEGLAIHNVLKDHPAHITVKVDGMAASIASVIMLAGDVVEVASNALVMAHRAMTWTAGTVDEIKEQIEILDKVEQSIITTYEERTNLSAAEAMEIMSVGSTNSGTWMNADEAIEHGFATTKGEEMKIAAKFTDMPYADAPAAALDILNFKEPEPNPDPDPEATVAVDADAVDALLERANQLCGRLS